MSLLDTLLLAHITQKQAQATSKQSIGATEINMGRDRGRDGGRVTYHSSRLEESVVRMV